MIDHETFACFSVESGHRGVRVAERMFRKFLPCGSQPKPGIGHNI